MSLVVACTPSIVPGARANTQEPIQNDGFLPAIDPDDVCASMRVPESFDPRRVRASCIGAMLRLAPDLEAWIAEKKAAGYSTLEAVPTSRLDGESRLVLLYERAVACHAKAELIERHRDVDQAGGGQRDAAAVDQTPGELRRDAHHALRQILERTPTTVELI